MGFASGYVEGRGCQTVLIRTSPERTLSFALLSQLHLALRVPSLAFSTLEMM
jgi:hypothetical protein